MTAKEYLRGIGVMQEQIRAMREKICSLGEAAVKDDLGQEVAELEEKRAKALMHLASLPDTRGTTLLIRRYVRGQSWKDIAAEMFISRASAFRIHKEALDNFAIPED